MREEDDAVISAVFLKRIRQTAKFTETANVSQVLALGWC